MFERALLRAPDRVWIEGETDLNRLAADGDQAWQGQSVRVEVLPADGQMEVYLTAVDTPVRRVFLDWRFSLPSGWRFLGDAWERGYGDLEWRGIVPERVMPWYVLAWDGRSSAGFGVKTNPAALAYWQVPSGGVRLVLDVRCGAQGVRLGERRLCLASIVAVDLGEVSPFQAARSLCARLCSQPRLPDHAVYGANDWYYRYGRSTHDSILTDARITADLASNADNRPYMVIDAGWQVGLKDENDLDSGDRTHGNPRFPDMPALAAALKDEGVRPGIWVRPLIAPDGTPASRLLSPAQPAVYAHLPILDPSLPENLAEAAADIRRLREWGYQLIKHDFTTVDILGRWGFDMGAQVTGGEWAFADRSRTTAEIIHNLYAAIRVAAGEEVLVIGCNTIGHLGTGMFDLQRTGDDTSGKEWERTRKMGVNTLAFRMGQHNTFFFADADCVGLTNEIPWSLNAQWLDLLARSGTPLFVSADPAALGPKQKAALAAAYAQAAQPQSSAEPVDWLDTVCPTRWRFDGQPRSYDWFS